MISVQEPFAEVVVPYGMQMGGRFFEIFNTLGIVFVPFIVIYLGTAFAARAKGADEGSWGVMAIKSIEVQFWAAAVVLWLFCIPWESGKNPVRNETFVCGYSQTNTAFGNLYKTRPKLNDSKTLNLIEGVDLPLALGFVNNLSVGISEGLSAQLTCAKSQSAVEAEMNKEFINIQNEPLVANLKSFSQQCFVPALERLSKAESDNASTIRDIYDFQGSTFFGQNVMNAYEGLHVRPQISRLTFNIRDTEYVPPIKGKYKPENYDPNSQFSYRTNYKTDKLAIKCKDAAFDYRLALVEEIERLYPEKVSLDHELASIAPKSKDKRPYRPTYEDVLGAYVHQAFLDSITGKRSIYANSPAMAERSNSNFFKDLKEVFTDSAETATSDTMGKLSDVIVTLGLAKEAPFKSAERANLYGTLPIYISLITACLYIGAPVVILLSGYKWNMAFNISFIIFYLAMCHYWLNVSYTITNIVWIIADSYYGEAHSLTSSYLAIHFIGYYSPFIVLTLWTAACTVAGLKLGPFFTSIFSGAAIAAAKHGQAVADAAGRKATGNNSGGGSGISPRQF